MAHEESETIEENGKWTNIYGQRTPHAGKKLPLLFHYEKPYYDTEQEAVNAAKRRSNDWHYEELRPNSQGQGKSSLEGIADYVNRQFGSGPTQQMPTSHSQGYHFLDQLLSPQTAQAAGGAIFRPPGSAIGSDVEQNLTIPSILLSLAAMAPGARGVPQGGMIGPERLRMLVQGFKKRPEDWEQIGAGMQGTVHDVPQ